METRDFSLAGWLSVALAVVLVPYVGVVAAEAWAEAAGGGSIGLGVLAFFLLAAITAASVWLYLEFRRLLNRSGFHGIDTLVPILIVLGIVMVFIPNSWMVIGLLLALVSCAVSIVFGIRLLKFSEDPTGLMKPFAYLLVAGSICMATVVLSPLGLLLGIAFYIVQAHDLFPGRRVPGGQRGPRPAAGPCELRGLRNHDFDASRMVERGGSHARAGWSRGRARPGRSAGDDLGWAARPRAYRAAGQCFSGRAGVFGGTGSGG